jgi:hypothetical protein
MERSFVHGQAAMIGTHRELLDVQRETAFTFDDHGRMVSESAPDRSVGKRLSVSGCPSGNLTVIRSDVPDDVAAELERVLATEPPLASSEAVPVHLEHYRDLLAVDGVPAEYGLGLLWVVAPGLAYDTDAELVWSGSPKGDRLLDSYVEVMSAELAAAGFAEPTDLWEPWCVALIAGRVVSIAETVRSGPRGAEVGVDTASGYRGQGLAAAVTARWSRHPDLRGKVLFYGTSRENASSRRVVARLGLVPLGATFAVV